MTTQTVSKLTAQPNQPNNISTSQNPVGRFMVAVGAVIEQTRSGIPSGKILILQRAATQDWRAGEWEIDYGRLAQFEDPETGLKREVLEETGIAELEIGQVLSAWHIYRGLETAVAVEVGPK